MGAYTWLNEQEFKRFETVNDEEINEALQEVRDIMPQWYIDEKEYISKSFWGKKTTHFRYTVYQRQTDSTEVRLQMSCNTKANVLNFLYGLYMGFNYNKL